MLQSGTSRREPSFLVELAGVGQVDFGNNSHHISVRHYKGAVIEVVIYFQRRADKYDNGLFAREGAYVLQRLPFMLAGKIITISQCTVKAYTISKKSFALSSATISTFSPKSSTSRAAKISTTGCSVAK